MRSAVLRQATWIVVVLIMPLGTAASAQRADSVRVTLPAAPRDSTKTTIIQPPISARRAFLYSLLLPGFAQSRLGRPTAGALFVFTESIGIAMLRESAADLREARAFRTDSLVSLGNDPVTGTPVQQRSPFTDELVSIRKLHVQDWVAFLIANHLFAGADAYVAAHLWDLPTQINVSQTTSGTVVGARIRW